MATLSHLPSQWHPGEQAIRALLHVPQSDNPTAGGLPASYGYRVMQSPLMAIGTLDAQERPWVGVWGGEKGFARPIANGVLGIRGHVDAGDVVARELFARKGDIVDDEVVKPDGGGQVMAALAIDLETRDRVKVMGRMMAGSARRTEPGVAEVQMAMQVQESIGNCPKYLNKKRISPHVPAPELVWQGKGRTLPGRALRLLERADLFFMASRYGTRSMDVNHRGGAPGFVRVARNSDSTRRHDESGGEGDGEGGVTLVYPEYSGNRLYQTLGNLHLNPEVGLVVPDFESGDVLHATGRATILSGERATAYLAHAKLVVKIEVEEVKFVADGLGFRGESGEASPYNPPVRRLVSERESTGVDVEAGGEGVATATLLRKQVITPSISRYVFKVSPSERRDGGGRQVALKAWHPGQHVTLDFSEELDHGYSHMRNDDPQSLNDDFIRTFTVSAPLGKGHVDEEGNVREGAEPEMEVVVRRHGPATGLLAGWNLRAPLELPVLGFGGAEGFRMPVASVGIVGKEVRHSVFVAGGVGITPLLAQAADILEGRSRATGELEVLWGLRGGDLALAVDVFNKIDCLAKVTKLFVTGEVDNTGRTLLSSIEEMGTVVTERRLGEQDVLGAAKGEKRRFYCCTGPEMMKALLQWTEGEDVVFESFNY
ncbi:hypothetical protein F5Y15DRAFT_392024 [Xylariaceae sp. FL0016]|nr:hypothetical protein F5Y15DRAFT_392024 [Xylariaceae sp. FL0016]